MGLSWAKIFSETGRNAAALSGMSPGIMFKLSALIFGDSGLGSALSSGRNEYSSRSQQELRKIKTERVNI
jgi:hypothetical protein